MKKISKSMRWTIGIAVIAGAIGLIATTQLSSNVVYFYTPDEAYAKAGEISGKNIKVGGMVLPGSVSWQPENLSLSFTISDLKGHDIRISHKGTPPDIQRR
jgi:cytochrome c-type biogenesis protein CcmE